MESLRLPEIVAIGVYNARLANKNATVTKNRKTTMFEIELPIENGGISFINEESAEVTKNLVICAKPGQIRHTRLPFKCYYIHIIAAEGEICERLMQIPDYVTVQDRAPYERIFKELCAHSEAALYQDILFIQSRILELIHLLCAHARYQQAPKVKSSNKNMIEDAVHFIKTNPAADLSLEAMAARYAFSPIHFHTCFKKATGKTLRDFAEEQRIGKAIHLLAATDLTLSEIAYECGFSSQAYFSYAFKKKMKAPPREYAKRLLKQYEK